jgi:glycogen phosphorylase
VGLEHRLKQEYFLSAATAQDIIASYKLHNKDWTSFLDLNSIHINDTQTAFVAIELFRIFLDEEDLPWPEAWYLVRHTISYSVHSM